ncbi:biotin/lipoyl-containing protein [Romboutsia weinsteinii]|uniref:biotin/lipoyl-containing protein n=1 Tax=Romboutsia weinsteinii TaxID=2020949 RepID=UPI0018F52BBE|nr:biotin/lipoyl-containing protein [Romboutsia weinsteinii]
MIKKYNITVNGSTYEVEVEELGASTASVERPQVSKNIQPKVQKQKAPSSPKGGGIVAPMPGTISDVKVSVGQDVKKGQVLVILEAMKMENEIMAPSDGKVSSVNVSKGASVSSGDLLVTLG